MSGQFYIFILTSNKQGKLGIGYTQDLVRHVYEHREDAVPVFTKKHEARHLARIEVYDEPRIAQQGTCSPKGSPRAWYMNPIERKNPQPDNCYSTLTAQKR